MDTSAPAIVKLRQPADVVGTLPHLIGFVPEESLVVLCLDGPRRRSGLTMRVDLPAVGDERAMAGQMALRTLAAAPAAAILAVWTRAPDDPGGLPRRALVEDLVTMLEARGTDVVEGLLVRGSRWWSYLCAGPCCPSTGTALPAVPTPAVTHVAAEAAVAGRVLLADRSALAATVAPGVGPSAAVARRQARDRAEDALHLALASRGPDAVRRETRALIVRAMDGPPPTAPQLADEEAARIVLGLRDATARDLVATLVLDHDAEPLLAVLAELARHADDDDAAPICTVLAWVAYHEGRGALANVALDRALACEPRYELAQLLELGLSSQVPPEQVRRVTRAVGDDLRAPG